MICCIICTRFFSHDAIVLFVWFWIKPSTAHVVSNKNSRCSFFFFLCGSFCVKYSGFCVLAHRKGRSHRAYWLPCEHVRTRFPVGARRPCHVCFYQIQPLLTQLVIFIRCFPGVPDASVLPDSALPAMSPRFKGTEKKIEKSEDVPSKPPPVVGVVVEGKVDLAVKAWAPPCLMVRLDGGLVGRVCVTEIAEEPEWTTDPIGRCDTD